ncbi:HNH endonuclease [Leptolyngbya sp. 'hensonii']|uniref:HNH endonuclease n=1 Tax=Leptolyngbya sp. 'hensonii' TaxID=1922337 RepID=UPI00095018C8|nr:HNH endonuclease [Leptolyngbya sp. 'hensonii']OLP15607.1 HNH endonuclease [Leptolyngbya sp. 'hensonii']
MPMDRRLYPENWEAIALAIKEAAGWKCQQCGRDCRRPGESDGELIDRVWDKSPDLFETEENEEFGLHQVPKFGRFVLTVAHLNHIPQDCRPENLRALCAPCHCRYDLAAMATKRRLKQEREGQLFLAIGGDDHAQA